MVKPHSFSTKLSGLFFMAIAAIVIPAAAAEVGDFAPLAPGNTWTYIGNERMLCKALWDEISVIRSITADSSRSGADGKTHFLSYRDSVHWIAYGRWGIRSGMPADALRQGRFLVREKTGQPELRVAPFGSDSLPSEMEFFFRSRTFPANRITPDTGDLAARGEVRYLRRIRNTVIDYAAYVKDVGMTRLQHNYNVFNTNNLTAPERLATYQLIAFKGMAVTPRAQFPYPEVDIPEDALSPKDFAPVALGTSWLYLGIRRVDSAGTVSRDSILRSITVKSGSGGSFILSLEDSLYARLRADKPLEPEIKSVDFNVGGGTALPKGNSGIGIWDNDSDPSWSDPLRFFNGKQYPAREVKEMAFPDGPRSVFVYAERSPGILVDTSVYAEGVGLVRRAKTMDDGRKYAEEFRLIEMRGKAFEAIPVSLAAPAASAGQRIIHRAGNSRPAVRTWRGRDAAGKTFRQPVLRR
ncbi:MAG: hypothetical protein ABIW76_05000 [Fibrobacteria bacterium]